jgi:hypothetical protein
MNLWTERWGVVGRLAACAADGHNNLQPASRAPATEDFINVRRVHDQESSCIIDYSVIVNGYLS